MARSISVHPYLEARDQTDRLNHLKRVAGLEEPTQRPKDVSAIAALGLKIVTGE